MIIFVLYAADGESDSSDDILKALEAVVDSKLWVWVWVGVYVSACLCVTCTCVIPRVHKRYLLCTLGNTKLQVCAWYVCVCLKASLCSGVCSPV